MYREKRGFTLIELLVVIAIIALLLSIILPSMKTAKSHARTVVCKSNLRQWGLVWKMYSDDFDGKFPHWMVLNAGYHRGAWIIPMREYFPERKKMLLCPEASKKDPAQMKSDGTWSVDAHGGTQYAYSMAGLSATENEWCSYGMNTWCTNKGSSSSTWVNQNRSAEKLWGGFDRVRNASTVPLMMDSMWRGGAPQISPVNAITPPSSEGQWRGYGGEIAHFSIPRHGKKGIGMLYVDLSVDNCKLKELWSRKWNREYDTGYVPSWPEWMEQYD